MLFSFFISLINSFISGLDAVKPENIIKNNLPEPPKGRTYVIGAGKAAASMAKAIEISWPKNLYIDKHHKIPVSLVDTTATILDLAGVATDITNLMELDGESLVPLMTGQPSNLKGEAFCEHLAHGTDRPRAMIRKGRFKLCYSHGGSVGASPDIELYDLETDPGEFKNLSGQIDY